MDISQYTQPQLFRYPERCWPDRRIDRSPIWCSVDLRDGNQALIEPMGEDRKRCLYKLLRHTIGFKQIEVGFPSASQTDFDFMRLLVDEDLLDDETEIQVLTQARPELIKRTFQSIEGMRRVIIHLYNSTSPKQREWVFEKSRAEIKQLAVDNAQLIRDLAEKTTDVDVRFQYSPESFTQTEMDYALEVCEAVLDVFAPTPEKKAIINLPSTVEVTGPNVFADQINWFCDTISRRDSVEISVHPHNDRGCAVASAELAVQAGADRVEGTLFGNGERTGNADLVSLALNLYTHGIDPALDFSDMPHIVSTVAHCNRMEIPERQPYAGKLVFTAFSGSHQDAIKKSLAKHRNTNQEIWDIPYLPINPEDLKSNYQAVIRVNSQSGKAGVSYILENDHGYRLPRTLQMKLSHMVQKVADDTETEISSTTIHRIFTDIFKRENPLRLMVHRTEPLEANQDARSRMIAELMTPTGVISITGEGSGPLEGFVQGLRNHWNLNINIQDYDEHAIRSGSDAEAVSYIQLQVEGTKFYGVGQHQNTTVASLQAILAGFNQYLDQEQSRG